MFAYLAQRGLERCENAEVKTGYAASDPSYPHQTLPSGHSKARLFQSTYKQLDCKKPQGEKEYELCQQWRSAKAADQQACVSGLQFWVGGFIGILGLGGLIGTVAYTALAAKAASESADVAEQSLKITQRAYVSVDPLGIRQGKRDEMWFAHVGVRNAGLLPARNVQWQIDIEPFSPNDDWKGFLYVHPRRGNHVIPPGTTMRRGSRRFFVDPRQLDERFMYVWGEITYTDGFGQQCYTQFCHRYNNKAIVSDGKGGLWIPPEDARYHDHGNEAT